MNKYWKKINDKIEKSNSILLSTHKNPDADGLGSEIAFYYYLKKIGKDCRIINISKINDNCRFLDPDNIIETYSIDEHMEWISSCDTAIIFDIGDFKRLGDIYKILDKNNSFKISIDHHPANNDFFNLSIINVNAAATGFMVWNYFKFLDINEFDIISSNALYASLISDTGSFRYNSTSSECHLMAKNLLDNGVEPYYVYSNLYEQREIHQIELFSIILQNINFYNNNEFASVKITDKMFNQAGCVPEDAEGIADFIRSIKGVEVSFVLSQMPDNSIKVNFRSRGKYIINDIANLLNGGGHMFAAGASVKSMSFDEVEAKIVEHLKNKSKEVYVN